MIPDLQYPIGKFEPSDEISPTELERWISDIERLPIELRRALDELQEIDSALLDTPYRPGGWSVRQVVHHIADSHMNGLVRTKWALTEDNPTIKPYDEKLWAKLADYTEVPISTTLAFVETLTARWTALLRALSTEDLARTFVHPESGMSNLAAHIGNYSWHGRHHVAHIDGLVRRSGSVNNT